MSSSSAVPATIVCDNMSSDVTDDVANSASVSDSQETGPPVANGTGLVPPNLFFAHHHQFGQQFPLFPTMAPPHHYHQQLPPPPALPPHQNQPPKPARPDTNKKRKQKKKSNEKNPDLRYTPEEKEFLGELMVEHLPIGKEAWDRVVDAYNKEFPDRPRNKDNLARQHNSIANSKVPTGDPNCPEFVRLHKKARHLTIKKSHMAACDSDDSSDADLAAVVMTVATDDDEEPSVSELETPSTNTPGNAAVSVAKTPSTKANSKTTTKKGRGKITNSIKSAKEDPIDKYLKVLMVQEKIKAEREERKEKRKEKKEKRQTKFYMQMMAAAVGALAGNKTQNSFAFELPSSSSSSSSSSCDSSVESMSSIDTLDSPPTKQRKKLMEEKKKKRNKKNAKKNMKKQKKQKVD